MEDDYRRDKPLGTSSFNLYRYPVSGSAPSERQVIRQIEPLSNKLLATALKRGGMAGHGLIQERNINTGETMEFEVSGDRIKADETIDSVCEVFGINRGWLVSGEGAMFAPGKEKSKADKEGIGDRIRKVRKDIALTQEQFGKAIGCSVTYIHFVESGTNIPSFDFLNKVSSVFGISYNYLLTGEEEEKSDEAVVDEELIEWLRRNPDEVRRLRIKSGLV